MPFYAVRLPGMGRPRLVLANSATRAIRILAEEEGYPHTLGGFAGTLDLDETESPGLMEVPEYRDRMEKETARILKIMARATKKERKSKC